MTGSLWSMRHVGPTVHVRPIDDLIEHDFDPDCVCGPTVKPVPGDDGAVAWIHFHHPLDDRTDRKP